VKELRPHQIAAHEGLRAGFKAGSKRGLLVIPTGGGKTITALEMLRASADRGIRGLFLCDRRTLVTQAAREARDYGISCGVVMRDAGPDWYAPRAPVQFASKDTLLARDLCPESGLVIVDEAHRSISEYWATLLDQYPRAWVVGLTATPARGDGRGLGRRYQFLVQPTAYSALIESGVLCPAVCYAPGKKVTGKTGKKPKRASLVGDVVGWWQRLAEGRRTFVFASSVAHSLALRDEFRLKKIPAEHLDGNTPDEERDAVLGRDGRMARGDTLVVTSCSVLKYGVDVPSVECVQIADGFASLVDYLQACGRGLRSSPGKTNCVVIDHAGAVLYHGFPDADRAWELTEDTDMAKDYRDRMKNGEAPKPIVCPECSRIFSGRPDCPVCGWRVRQAQGQEVNHKGGKLNRVEREPVLKALPEDYRKAWVQCLAVARHQGRTLSSAASMFRQRFGIPPWAARGAAPLPSYGYDWKTPASVFWDQAIARQKSA
jgi:DNA repair protein RadD